MDDEQAVVLVPSRHEEWAQRFTQLAARIEPLLPGADVEHIGSTAVPGLPAKDVVDLLIGVEADDVVPVARRLATAGFDLEGEFDHHCWLSSPHRQERDSVLHVVEYGNRSWHNRLRFRDLLRQDATARQTYLRAKQEAAQQAQGWDAYTQAKTSVVRELLALGPVDHPRDEAAQDG